MRSSYTHCGTAHIQGTNIRPGVTNKEEKTGLGQGPSTSGQSTSLQKKYDCICTIVQAHGQGWGLGCSSKRFGNDYGHGRGNWEVERVTLKDWTEAHTGECEEKEEER